MSLEWLILATWVLKESSDSARHIWLGSWFHWMTVLGKKEKRVYSLSALNWRYWYSRRPYLSVNKDSHQLLQGGFVFYKGWSAWNLLFFVRGISSLDHEACQIHWMYYDTFLLPTLLPSSEPSLTDILACVLFCRLLWDFFIHFGSHTVLQYSSLGRTIDL